MQTHIIPRHIRLMIVAIALASPLNAIGDDPLAPVTQDFVITAYYSPLPGQCCYVKGGYVADKILNGEGVSGADGTGVYPGMLAAPPTLAFGTRIDLPGIGTMTVHDRGGAIQVLGDGAMRLDIWAGYGEEGLARALAFGVRRVTATIYPVGSAQPAEAFSLDALTAPLARLEPFLLDGTTVVSIRPKKGERSLSVQMLQEHLRTAGFLDRSPSGFFGDETAEALAAFNAAYGLREASDRLTETSAATLLAAVRRIAAESPLTAFVDPSSDAEVNREAQRLLRFLGFYRGRTDGVYDADLQASILSFQQKNGLAGDAASPGAGRIGPMTTKALQADWNRKLVAARAKKYLTVHRISEILAERNGSLAQFLSEGDGGPQVTLLQRLLAERGYFPEEKINGNFGALTKESLIAWQKDAGIIAGAHQTGAGTVGPGTLSRLREEEKMELYRLVRAQGWRVL